MPQPEPESPREAVIANLIEVMVTGDGDEAAQRQAWAEATDDERRAFAALVHDARDTLDVAAQVQARSYARARALMDATSRLMPYWDRPYEDFTVARGLKVAPRRIVYNVLVMLWNCGFTEADGLPDLGDPPGPDD